MSSILTPLALSLGLNSDPALYDRLQFEGLLKPGFGSAGSQLAHADVGYKAKNFEVSAKGSTTLDRKFTGFGAETRIPLEILDLTLNYDFFNPSVGKSVFSGSFGAGESYEAQFGTMKGEVSLTGDSSNYVSGKFSGSAQHLNQLLKVFLELSHKAGDNRQKLAAEYFWKPSDAFEVGVGLGSSQRGLEGMLSAAADYSKLRVEVKALGNNQYQVATVGLSWNGKGTFDEAALNSNKYVRKLARIEKISKAETKQIRKSLTARNQELKEQLGLRTEKEKQELSELVSDAHDLWGNYKKIVPEDDIIQVSKVWRQVYDLDPTNRQLKKFIASTTESRYALVDGYYRKGIDTYADGNLPSSVEYFRKVLLILTGSEDGDVPLISTDPRKLVDNCKANIDRILRKQEMIEKLVIPTSEPSKADSNSAPKAVSSTSKPK